MSRMKRPSSSDTASWPLSFDLISASSLATAGSLTGLAVFCACAGGTSDEREQDDEHEKSIQRGILPQVNVPS